MGNSAFKFTSVRKSTEKHFGLKIRSSLQGEPPRTEIVPMHPLTHGHRAARLRRRYEFVLSEQILKRTYSLECT